MFSKFEIVEIRFAVRSSHPESDLARVAEVIGSFDVTGLVIDGSSVGAPGWILARTLGDPADSTIMRYDPDTDSVNVDLPWHRVQDALKEALDTETHAGTELHLDGCKVHPDGLFALGGEHHALLIGPKGDYMFRAVAAGLEADLVAAPMGEHVVVARREPSPDAELTDDLSGGMFSAAAALGRKPGFVLWRRGAVVAFMLIRKGEPIDGQVWAPSWTVISPRSLHSHDLADWVGEVAEDLQFRSADGEGLIKAFRLDAERSMRLRSVLRRSQPDIAELTDVLGLPPEVEELFAGRSSIADLPGATVYQALSVRSAIVAEMRGPQKLGRSDDEPERSSRWRRR